jgi:hypothetical protein
MASTHNAVVVTVDSYNPDVALAHRAAALLTFLQPRKTAELVVPALLDQLKNEKIDRESRGLNHWDKYAPQFLSGLVWQVRREKRLRYQEAEAFFKAKHREALRCALAIVGNFAAAEAVVSDTYRELLMGSATIAGFFAALVCNARNYLESDACRRDKFVPQDDAFSRRNSGSDNADGDDQVGFEIEPMSHRRDDQDPLNILIAREDDETRRREIETAKTIARGCRKYRWVRAKHWSQDLDIRPVSAESVTDSGASPDM